MSGTCSVKRLQRFCFPPRPKLLALLLLAPSPVLLGGPAEMTVPQVVGLAASEAKTAIEAANLIPKLQIGEPAPDASRVFQVYQQTPTASALVKQQTEVRLLLYGPAVGNGEGTQGPHVPDLIGSTAQGAKAALARLGLECTFRLGPPAPGADQALTVFEQAPEAGVLLNRGAVVSVTIYAQTGAAPSQPGTSRSAPGTTKAVPTPPSSAPRAGQSRAADHFVDNQNRLTAIDLSHGGGPQQLGVTRVWLGDRTLNRHFGSGWSDPNQLRLSRISDDTLALWRGGVAWQLARRDDDVFRVATGVTLHQVDDGWRLDTEHDGHMLFDVKGRLAATRSPFGQLTRMTYDEQGRLVAVDKGQNNTLRYFYEGDSERVTEIAGPEGLEVRYIYNDHGWLASIHNARNVRIEYRYTEDGRLLSAGDQFGDIQTAPEIGEDVPEEMAESVTPDNDDATEAPKYLLDRFGRIVEEQWLGRTTTRRYNDAGGLAEIISADETKKFGYDAYGRLDRIALSNGQTIRITYDRLDQPTTIAVSDGRWKRWEYDGQGQLVRETSSDGTWLQWQRDQHGRPVLMQAWPGLEHRIAYNARDYIAQIDDSEGQSVRYDYDEDGRVVSQIWATGRAWSYQYDGQGRMVRETFPTGLAVQFGYDEQGRPLWQDDPLRGRRQWEYSQDQHGRVARQWAGIGTSWVEVDRGNRVLAASRGPDRSMRLLYDRHKDVVGVTLPSGGTWRYLRDDAGRLTGVTSPAGVRTRLERDDANRLTSIARGDVAWRQLLYSPAGRLQAQRSASGIAAAYDYDDAGRLAAVHLQDGKVVCEYDDEGRSVGIEGPHWRISSEYRADARLARQKYEPAGLDLQLPTDQLGRPSGITLGEISVGYAYDDRGAVNGLVMSDGRTLKIGLDQAGRPVDVTCPGVLSISRVYDAADRVVEVKALGPTSEELLTESYEFDADGNLTSINESVGGSTSMQYDADGQLVESSAGGADTSYDYDRDGNLRAVVSADRATIWELDRMGRPLREGTGEFYTWDSAGNLAAIRSVEETAVHKFDAADQLVRRDTGKGSTTFGYLPNGDRLWRHDDSGTTWYLYGEEGLIGMATPSGLTYLVVYLPETDIPVALCGSDGSVRLVVADRLGSMRRMVDTTGRLVYLADFGPYGRILRHEGASPLAVYAGMLCDELDLYFARKRYYAPQLARFVSLDPVLGSASLPLSHNPYCYAANNPYRYGDADGCSPGVPRADYFGQDYVDHWDGVYTRQADRANRARQGLENLRNLDRPPVRPPFPGGDLPLV